jgi:carboxyl-terminal processing protease
MEDRPVAGHLPRRRRPARRWPGRIGGSAYGTPPGTQPACVAATTPAGPVTPTTVDVIGQAYRCVHHHYVDAPRLDDRQILTGAFAGLTREPVRRGLDPDSSRA